MRVSPTLFAYTSRQFLFSFATIFVIFLALILMFDVVELLRRSATRPQITISMVLEMALLKLPSMGQQSFPFAVLCGAMLVFWRMTRSHELVVTRGAGVSAWQFLLPVLVVTLLLGVAKVAVTNPLAAAMLSRYERLEAILLKDRKSSLALSDSGLWLRQAGTAGQLVLRARSMLQQGADVEMREVIVFMYEGSDRFVGRIDAERARLEDGFWHLHDAWVYVPEQAPQFETEYWLETDLTQEKIQDSFAPPGTMSFWALPDFIDTLEDAGFSAVRHRLHWHSLLAAPLLMCAMILIAATFTLRHARRGGTSLVIACGVLTGFMLYFFSDIVFALGLSGSIPVTLAAWTPSGVATLLGLAMLLHMEDG